MTFSGLLLEGLIQGKAGPKAVDAKQDGGKDKKAPDA